MSLPLSLFMSLLTFLSGGRSRKVYNFFRFPYMSKYCMFLFVLINKKMSYFVIHNLLNINRIVLIQDLDHWISYELQIWLAVIFLLSPKSKENPLPEKLFYFTDKPIKILLS